MDVWQYQIIFVVVLIEEEWVQFYFWCFWWYLLWIGWVVIFDCLWYGCVLVEWVEGFCFEFDWLCVYVEINDFEY